MADFFDKVQKAARQQGVTGNTRKAREWFRKRVKELSRGHTANDIMKSKNDYTGRPQIGNMYFYFYNPKTKAKLPYYDKFPLTIVIETYSNGFLGLNLHYLPPKTRGLLMSKLMDLATDKQLDEKTQLAVSYKFLTEASKYKEVKPCIKRYLYSHMKSRAMRVPAADWLPAVFLPLARFEKAGKSKVWSDSRLKIK